MTRTLRENGRDAFAKTKSGKYKNLFNSGVEYVWILPNKILESVSKILRVVI